MMEKIVASDGARGTPTPPRPHRPVGIVGFGLLGEAFARRLRQAGWHVVACDPAPARRECMAALGVASAESVAAVAAQARCVLLAVYDAQQVRSALRELAAHADGEPLHVLCATTLSPEDACALAEEHAGGALRFIEMPVSGSSLQVLQGKALALIGCEDVLPPELERTIDVLCPGKLRVGGRAAAARMKLVINLVLEINRAALAEGLVLAEAFGLDLELTELALRGSAAASRVMDLQARKMRLRDFAPAARLAQSLKDMQAMLAGGRGDFLPLATAARGLLASSVRAGDGALDTAAIVDEVRRLAARKEALPC